MRGRNDPTFRFAKDGAPLYQHSPVTYKGGILSSMGDVENGQGGKVGHPPDKGSKDAQYNALTKSITLNKQMNWTDPTKVSATLDGKPYSYNALTAQANYLGVPGVTSRQYIDCVVMHELEHYNGTIGNPDLKKVEQQLWIDCIN